MKTMTAFIFFVLTQTVAMAAIDTNAPLSVITTSYSLSYCKGSVEQQAAVVRNAAARNCGGVDYLEAVYAEQYGGWTGKKCLRLWYRCY